MELVLSHMSTRSWRPGKRKHVWSLSGPSSPCPSLPNKKDLVQECPTLDSMSGHHQPVPFYSKPLVLSQGGCLVIVNMQS